MTSQITLLLELVHYPTKKFEYRNQIETIHIIIKYIQSKGLLFKLQGGHLAFIKIFRWYNEKLWSDDHNPMMHHGNMIVFFCGVPPEPPNSSNNY